MTRPERQPRRVLTPAQVEELRKLVGYTADTTAEEHRLAAAESTRWARSQHKRINPRPE